MCRICRMTVHEPGGQISFDLWDGPTPSFLSPAGPTPVSIDERFTRFHEANPWVYTALVRLCRDMKSRGRDRLGIKMLFEVVRWEYTRHTVSDQPFRLNNDFSARYARLIEAQEEDLIGMFAMRELRAA